MNELLRRILSFALGIGILLGAFFVSGMFQKMRKSPEKKPEIQQPKTVSVMMATNGAIQSDLLVQGRLVAPEKIEIYAEVGGLFLSSDKPFEVGTSFLKGQALARIDAEEARLSIFAQKSTLLNAIARMMPDMRIDNPESAAQWQDYLAAFDVTKAIVPLPTAKNSQEKYYVAAQNIYSQYYTIKSAEERLGKYILRAPFSGVITQALIDKGAVVRPGQKMGELMNTSQYELEATIPLGDMKYLQPGSRVALHSEDVEGLWSGQVKRINDQVDPNTQTVKVYIAVQGKNLREGMYLQGNASSRSINNALRIPRELLVDGKYVYGVEDSLIVSHEVKLVKMTDDDVIIQGLPSGTPILSEMLPGLYPGAKVGIRNAGNKPVTETRVVAADQPQE